MFRPLIACGFVVFFLSFVATSPADEKITLAVPGIQCQRCVESLTGTLGKADSPIKVSATLETKQLEVIYDPSKLTLHQIVAAVSEAPPVHNMPYEAGVLVTIDDPAKSAAKLKKALGQIKGITNFIAMPGGTPESADIMIVLRPLARNAKLADQVKASQIADALEKSGVRFSGLPIADTRGVGDESDAKKKPSSKQVRTTPSSPKTKSIRESSSTQKSKEKESESEERPRFVILAGDSDKVYLVDHETKNDGGKELKKLVKQGDKFGDYVVKQVGDDDGLYVVLEHTESKDTVRVEHKKKDKDSDHSKDSDAKSKDSSAKVQKD